MKAILFDAGNTLVWLDHSFLLDLLRQQGIVATEHQLLAAEYRAKAVIDRIVRSENRGTDESRSRIYFAELFRGVGAEDGVIPALAEALLARHTERNLWTRVRDGTAEALQELRRRGHTLGVISNADGRVEVLLESVGLRPWLDFVIDSASAGIEKPDPRIFHLGCELAGVAPEDALYVGDIYEIDIVGARGAGMQTMLIDPLDRWTELECDRIMGVHELPGRVGSAGGARL